MESTISARSVHLMMLLSEKLLSLLTFHSTQIDLFASASTSGHKSCLWKQVAIFVVSWGNSNRNSFDLLGSSPLSIESVVSLQPAWVEMFASILQRR